MLGEPCWLGAACEGLPVFYLGVETWKCYRSDRKGKVVPNKGEIGTVISVGNAPESDITQASGRERRVCMACK